MTSGERVKTVRKELGLSMEKFGERLGVTKSAISRVENNKSTLTEQMAKSICNEYNVDYFWLTEGIGEMFIKVPSVLIDGVMEKYKLNKTKTKAYVYLMNLFIKI